MRIIAIHLPQFHRIPENDKWWGNSFTQWTNVTKSKPLFNGHYQPQFPADLGFYDLRLEESRLAQETLAKEYGIYGFCYYYYWFYGKKILNGPFDKKILQRIYLLCSVELTKIGLEHGWYGYDVLLKQEYIDEDDIQHI